MKSPRFAAEALAAWTLEALTRGERSLARQELPALDVGAFCRAFAAVNVPGGISLALVGFGVDAAGLGKAGQRAGAKCFTHFATDLHTAAAWRNNRHKHPVIVAYARGRTAGVNTLRHFTGATSGELTVRLLRWAAQQAEFRTKPAHGKFLEELAAMQTDDAFSFEQVRAFLEAWSTGAGDPREVLPALGLLRDPNLFTDATLIRARMDENMQMVSQLRDRSAGQMSAVRKRLAVALEKSGSKKEVKARLAIFDKLQIIRRSPTAQALHDVTLDDAQKVFAPPPAAEPEEASPADDDDDDEAETGTRTLNEKKLQRTCAEALLDNREEELERHATALSAGLREALDDGDADSADGEWTCELEVQGEAVTFEGHVDRKFTGWVRHFCRNEVWGGLIETETPDLERALADFDRPGTLLLQPEQLLQERGQQLSLTSLLHDWDEQTGGKAGLVKLWTRVKELRGALLGSLEELTHFPLEWFSGKSAVRSQAEEYLRVYGELFGSVGRHFGAMKQEDAKWAGITLDGLLALDVVQVRVRRQDGKFTSKAVLLPTHPLHLWRYWRLSNILRGLGPDLNKDDRAAVVQEASAPVQFLSVIYASPLPGKRGAHQVLPVANDLHRLATFENLRNAYHGPDGQESLIYAVERFAAAHPLHVKPLRLVLVNAPQAGSLLIGLLKMLDGRKKHLVKRLRVEVRGTPHQAARLHEALLFDTREREIIEEKVAAGSLDLIVDREPRPLEDILAELKLRPVHVVAVFDEAPVNVRRGGAGQRLPMSPFCVRRKVAFHKRWNELRLEPESGNSPFFEFIELIKHAEGSEGEGTPYAWPEAEALRQSVDSVIHPQDAPGDFGAHWFFLADRALPEEGEMRAQRLLRRRDGQRQVLLAARDYEALARLMLPIFEVDTPNLLMPVPALQQLMAEGAHFIGAGLLDLVQSREGRVNPARVTGLMGTLLAARDYMRRHPHALLVSTDSQLARTWLRLGIQGERCDLLALREAHGKLVMECIEVKTTKGKPRDVTDKEIKDACDQVAATRRAVAEGLGDTSAADSQGHYLSAPRNEMLKEVLVQGCMGRFADVPVREQWAQWLTRLFGPNPEMPEMTGCVVDVALGSSQVLPATTVIIDGQSILLCHLNEIDVERLLNPPSDESGSAPDTPPEDPPPKPPAPRKNTDRAVTPAATLRKASSTSVTKKPATQSKAGGSAEVILGTDRDDQPVTWSPSIASNPHLMIAGLPGMGKTTCLINICRHLVANGVMPIVFSYHDDIDEKLGEAFPDLTLSDGRSLGFNPLRVTGNSDHAYIEVAGLLRDIFSAIFPDLGELQLEKIRNAIKVSFEDHGWGGSNSKPTVPPFRHFVELLRSQSKPDARTQTLLARLAELDDFGFFNAESAARSLLDADHPQVLRVHLSRSEGLQRAYASFCFYSIYQDMFRRGRQDRITHAIIFDEAHRAAKLKLLPTMAKECRKYGLALIVASQETRDFDASLFSNIANYLILRVTDQDARAVARNVGPSDAERRTADRLKALPKYEAMFFTESSRQPRQLRLRET